MFCILAFIVLSIMGLFSASHRELAKEAWQCVFRRITFRPCTVGFKEKMKGRLVAALLARSTVAARILNKYFEVLAWVIVILTIGSTFLAARGVYNYYVYGSCNGLNSTGFCVFDPKGDNNKISELSTNCPITAPKEQDVKLNNLPINEFPTKNKGARDQVVFIGCYNCDYTRAAYPNMSKLINDTGAQFTFVHFPVKSETEYLNAYDFCVNKIAPDKFWQWNDRMFASAKTDVAKPEYVQSLLTKSGIDTKSILECVAAPETKKIVDEHEQQIVHTGIYGTPTIFFNGRAYVGPKPYRVYRAALWW